MAQTQGGTFNPTEDIVFSGAVTFSNATSQSGTLVTTDATQTLTDKNLTAPTITGTVAGNPTITAPTITAGVVTPKVTAYAVDGAITVESHVAVLTKAGVNAMTLALPSSQDGTTIVVTSTTANAHTITCANGFNAGETGAPFNKVTLAAFPGSSATLVAYGALWYVVSDQVATVGD